MSEKAGLRLDAVSSELLRFHHSLSRSRIKTQRLRSGASTVGLSPESGVRFARCAVREKPHELTPIKLAPSPLQAGQKLDLPLGQEAHRDLNRDSAHLARLASSATDKSTHRRNIGAVGKHGAGKHGVLDTQMVAQQSLQHGAQIRRRLQIAILE